MLAAEGFAPRRNHPSAAAARIDMGVPAIELVPGAAPGVSNETHGIFGRRPGRRARAGVRRDVASVDGRPGPPRQQRPDRRDRLPGAYVGRRRRARRGRRLRPAGRAGLRPPGGRRRAAHRRLHPPHRRVRAGRPALAAPPGGGGGRTGVGRFAAITDNHGRRLRRARDRERRAGRRGPGCGVPRGRPARPSRPWGMVPCQTRPRRPYHTRG